MANKNVEGPTSEHVLNPSKILCPRCNSPFLQLSNILDSPIDITKDKAFAALKIESDSPIMGLVAVCITCGNEWVPLWYTFDVVATDGTNMTMTLFNTDRAANAVVNLCEGLFMVNLVPASGDVNKYVTIATNTANDPAQLTPQAHNANGDGYWMITNVLPFGLTAV